MPIPGKTRLDGIFRQTRATVLSEYALRPVRFFSFLFALVIGLGVLAFFGPIRAQLNEVVNSNNVSQTTVAETIQLDPQFIPVAEVAARSSQPNEYFKGNYEVVSAEDTVKLEQPKTAVGETEISLTKAVGGETITDQVKIDTASPDEIKISDNNQQLSPGAYDIKTLKKNTDQVVNDQKVLWGVLAFNPDYAVYPVGKEAFFSLAVLDDRGKMVCTAAMTVEVTDPNGKITTLDTANGTVRVNKDCEVYGKTDRPDYEANYQPKAEGNYKVKIIAKAGEGTRTLHDQFSVKANQDFYLQRVGATRTYPPVDYDYTLNFEATKDGSYGLDEFVPNNFEIKDTEAKVTKTADSPTKLHWTIDAKAGQTYSLTYSFKTPNISPFLFELGPASVDSASVATSAKEATTAGKPAEIENSSIENSLKTDSDEAQRRSYGGEVRQNSKIENSTKWVEPRSWLIASDNACQSAATGNWSDALSWTNCGFTTPQAGDTVQILNTHNITEDTASVTVAGVTIDNGGTLTVSTTNAITVSGNWSNSGTFTAASGTVTFSSTATGKTLGGTMTGATGKFYNLTFNGAAGGWTFSNAVEVANDFNGTNGAITAGNQNLTVTRDFTLANTAGVSYTAGSSTLNIARHYNDTGDKFAHDTSTVIMSGTGTFTSASGSQYYNLQWGSSGFTTTISTNSFDVYNVLTFNGGTVAEGGSSWLNLHCTISCTPVVFASATTLTGNRDLYFRPDAASLTITIPGGNYGSWGVDTYTASNSNTWQLGGNVTTTGVMKLQAANGVTGSAFTTTASNYSITALLFSIADCAPTRTGSWAVSFNASVVSLTSTTDALYVGPNCGTHTLNLGSSSVSIAGNLKYKDGTGVITVTPGTSTVTFNAVATGKTITSNAQSFYNIIFNGSGGGWTLQDAMSVTNNFDITNGTLDTNSTFNYALTVGGNFTGNSGTWTLNERNSTITVSGNWNTSAIAQDSVNIVEGGSTVIMDGTGTKTITTGATNTWEGRFWNLNVGQAVGKTTQMQQSFAVENVLTLGAGTFDLNSKTFFMASPPTNPLSLAGTWGTGNGSLYFHGGSANVNLLAYTYNSGLVNSLPNTYSLIFQGTTTFTGNLTVSDCCSRANITNLNGQTVTFNGSVTFSQSQGILTMGAANLTVKGSWTNSIGGTFNADTGTVDFAATSGTQTIISGGTGSTKQFYNLTHSGASTLSLSTNAVQVANDLSNTGGTMSGSVDVTVNGSATGVGAITMSGSSTFTQRVAAAENFGTTSGSSAWTFVSLTFSNSHASSPFTVTTQTGGSGGITVSSILRVGASGDAAGATTTLNAGNRTWTLSGAAGDPFQVLASPAGSLTGSTSTFAYRGENGAGNTTIERGGAGSYFNLDIGCSAICSFDTYVLEEATTATGNLTIQASAILDAVSGSNWGLTIGGNYLNSGTFTARSGTVTFNATDTGNTLGGTLSGSSSFYNLIFNGAAGEWTPSAAVNINGDITMTAGTLLGTQNVTANSNVAGTAGAFSLTGGTFLQTAAASKNFGTTSGSTAWTFSSLSFSNTGVSGITFTTQTGGSGGITVSGILKVGVSGDAGTATLDAGNRIWTLSGTGGDPFQLLASPAGALTGGTSKLYYTGANAGGNTTIQSMTSSYYDLELNAADTFVLEGDTVVTNNLTITHASAILDVTVSNYALTIGNNYSNSGTFTAQSGTITFNATDTGNTLAGTMTSASAFYNLTFNGSGGEWTPSAAVTATNDLTMTAGSLLGTQDLSVGDGGADPDLTGNGTINLTGGTLTLGGSGAVLFGGNTAWTFNNLSLTASYSAGTAIAATGSGGITVSGIFTLDATADTLSFDADAKTYTLSGTNGNPFVFTASPTFTATTSTFTFTGNNGAGNTIIQSTTYYNLTPNNGSEIYVLEAATITSNNLTITAGTLDVTAGNFALTIGGSYSNSGTFLANSGTVTFNATTTGKTLTGTMTGATGKFYVLTFNGVGGGWTYGAAVETASNFNLTNGTVDADSTGNYALTVAGDLTFSSGTTYKAQASTITVSGNWTQSNSTWTTQATGYGTSIVVLSGTTKTITTNGGSGTHFNKLTISGGAIYTQTATDIHVISDLNIQGTLNSVAGCAQAIYYDGGTGTTLTIAGTIGGSGGCFHVTNATPTYSYTGTISVPNFYYSMTGSTTIPAYTYAGNLYFRPASGTQTYTIGAGTMNVYTFVTTNNITGALTIDNTVNNTAWIVTALFRFTSTAGTVAMSLGSASYAIGSNWENLDTAVITPGTSTVTMGNATADGDMTSAGQSFYNLIIDDTGDDITIVDALTVTNDLTITAGDLNGTQNVTVSGNVAGTAGTITMTGGTFEQRVGAAKNFGTTSGSTAWTFYDLTFSNPNSPICAAFFITTQTGGSGGITVSDVMRIGKAADGCGTYFDAGNRTWTLSGTTGDSFQILASPAGSLTAASSTFTYTGNNGAGSTTIQSATYYDLIPNNSSETFVLEGTTGTGRDLTVTNGSLDTTGSNYAVNVARDLTLANTAGVVLIGNGSTITVGNDFNDTGNKFTEGTASTVNMTGTADNTGTLNSASQMYNLQLAGSGKTITVGTSMNQVNGVMTLNGGTVSQAASYINLAGSISKTPLVFGAATTLTGGSVMSFLINGGAGSTFTMAGGNYGNWAIEPYATANNSIYNFAGDITTTGSVYVAANTAVTGTTVNTQNFALTAATLQFGDGNAGRDGPVAVGFGSSTVTLSSTTNSILPHATYGGTSSTLNLGSSSVTVSGAVLFINGTPAITVTPGTSTITWVHTSGSKTYAPNGQSLYNVILNGSGGTVTPSGAVIITNDLTITLGTFDTTTSNHAVNVTRDVAIAGSASAVFRARTSTITVSRHWTVDLNGVFTRDSSTVQLNGDGNIAGTGTTQFENLTVAYNTKTTTMTRARTDVFGILTIGDASGGTMTCSVTCEFELFRTAGADLVLGTGATLSGSNATFQLRKLSAATVTVTGATNYGTWSILMHSDVAGLVTFNVGGNITTSGYTQVKADATGTATFNTQNYTINADKWVQGDSTDNGATSSNWGSSTATFNRASATDTFYVNSNGGTHTANFQTAFISATGHVKFVNGTGTLAVDDGTSTFTFAPSTGTSTYSPNSQTLYNVIVNGAATVQPDAAVAIANDLTMTAGTLNGTQNITVNGNVAGTSGVISLTGGTFEQRVGVNKNFGTTSGSTAWTFYDLTFSNSLGAPAAGRTITTQTGGSGGITVSDILRVGKSGDSSGATTTLDAGNRTWTLSGTTGDSFQLLASPAGALTAATSTFAYTGNNAGGNSTVQSATYHHLTVNNGSEVYVLEEATLTDNGGNLTITAGEFDVTATPYALTVGGNWSNSGTFTARTGTVTFSSTSTGRTLTGTMTGGSALYNIIFNGSGGGWTLQDAMSVTNNFDITNGTFDTNTTFNYALTIGGNLTGNAGTWSLTERASIITVSGNWDTSAVAQDSVSIVEGTSTVVMNGTGTKTIKNGSTNAWEPRFYNLTVGQSGNTTQLITNNGAAHNGTFTLGTGTFDFNSKGMNKTGGSFSLDPAGTFGLGNGSIDFSGSANFTLPAFTYNTTITDNISTGYKISLAGTTTITGSLRFGWGNSRNSEFDTANQTLTVGTFIVAGNTGAPIFTAGSSTVYVGTNFTNESNAVFNAGTSTFIFNATATSKTIQSAGDSFYNLTFSGSGGGWAPQDALVVTNDLTMTAGSLLGTQNITVNGNVAGTAGIINLTGGTFTQSVAGAKNFGTTSGSTAWTFSSLTFTASPAATITTQTGGTGDITVSSVMSISSAATTFDGGNRTYHLTGSGTPFSKTGLFTANASTISYENTTSANITSGCGTRAYYNLQTSPASGTPTYTMTTSATSFLAGTQVLTPTGSTPIEELKEGDLVKSYDLSSNQVVISPVVGTVIGTKDAYYIINNQVQATANHVFIMADHSSKAVEELRVGDLLATYSGTEPITSIQKVSETVTVYDIEVDTYNLFYANSYLVHNACAGTEVLGNFTLTGAGSAVVNAETSDPAITVTGNLTIGANQTYQASSAATFAIKGNYANSGTFTANTGTTTLSGTSTQTLSGGMLTTNAFYDLTITNSSGTIASDCERTGWVAGVDFNAAATVTNNYTITTASVKVEYESGATYTINNMNWNGQAVGTRLYFRNSAITGSWLLNVAAVGNDQIKTSYVNVSRSDASGGSTIIASDGTNTDCGNTVNWIFGQTLTLGLDSTSKDFGTINPGSNPSDQTSTLTASSNALNGYVVYAWSTQAMTNVRFGGVTLADWTGTNATPTTFSAGSYGFGYSTDDSSLTGGTADRFTNGGAKFAGFSHTGPGDPVADRTAPATGATNDITYRLYPSNTQANGDYTADVVYVITATFP